MFLAALLAESKALSSPIRGINGSSATLLAEHHRCSVATQLHTSLKIKGISAALHAESKVLRTALVLKSKVLSGTTCGVRLIPPLFRLTKFFGRTKRRSSPTAMPRGGSRPGAGRKPLVNYSPMIQTIKDSAQGMVQSTLGGLFGRARAAASGTPDSGASVSNATSADDMDRGSARSNLPSRASLPSMHQNRVAFRSDGPELRPDDVCAYALQARFGPVLAAYCEC